MSTFWSVFVTIVTLAMLAGCYLLLRMNRESEIPDEDAEGHGHEFDGITELETPLPRWWYNMFVGTIAFAVGYLLLYPGLGNFAGVLGWSQVTQWQAEVDRADERYSPRFDRYAATPIEELVEDPKAMAMGQRVFGNFCSQCHGTAAQGYPGFPNLTDDAWIWGGSPAAIKTSIVQGRRAAMPPWGPALGEAGVVDTTEYVLSLTGRSTDDEAVARGRTHYMSLCIACHGPEGKGNALLGAPDLTDDAWVYGGDAEAIATGIDAGRNGVMPAHGDLLDEARIHLVAAWVYSLSVQAREVAGTAVPAGAVGGQ
jgi:cytochrome c oxidase cbb3-type subunit 3